MTRNRLLVLFLIASAALNLALIASRLYSKIVPARPPVPPSVEFQPGFRIDPAQKERVDTILRKFKIDSIAFKEDIVAKRIEILEELGNPGYDVNQVRKNVRTQSDRSPPERPLHRCPAGNQRRPFHGAAIGAPVSAEHQLVLYQPQNRKRRST